MMGESAEYTESSGNVFADLGFDEPEEELAKAEILIQLADAVVARGLTRARAAKVFAISQSEVLALLSGSEGFSLERLIRLLLMLDKDVSIVVEPKRRERGQLSVVAR